jgi:hypothetical protein
MAKIGKIKVAYVQENQGKKEYKTKTLKLEIPCTQYGFTQTLTLQSNIDKYLMENVVPTNIFFKILNFQIVSVL